MRDLETIIVFVLPAFNFISQKLDHSLSLLSSRLSYTTTAAPTAGDGTTTIKVELMADQSILQNEKKLRGVQEEQ